MSSDNGKFSWGAWVGTCVGMYGLYLLFVSTLAKPELYVGIGAAVVATLGAGIFGAIGAVKFRPALKDVIQVWRVPWYVIEGTYAVFHGLCRQLFTLNGAPSLMRAVSFDVGGDNARSAARRALAVGYTTLTPNSIVLGIAHKQRLLLYHQVLAGDVHQMTINLGADPHG